MLLLLYVDDTILTGNDQGTPCKFIQHIGQSYAIKDTGALHFFFS